MLKLHSVIDTYDGKYQVTFVKFDGQFVHIFVHLRNGKLNISETSLGRLYAAGDNLSEHCSDIIIKIRELKNGKLGVNETSFGRPAERDPELRKIRDLTGASDDDYYDTVECIQRREFDRWEAVARHEPLW